MLVIYDKFEPSLHVTASCDPLRTHSPRVRSPRNRVLGILAFHFRGLSWNRLCLLRNGAVPVKVIALIVAIDLYIYACATMLTEARASSGDILALSMHV